MHKCVIHAHTNYSFDSNVSPQDLIDAARREGVSCVAVTDHDEIAGAIEVRESADDLTVIVGEEVSTADGHLIGLFLNEWIPPGMSAIETAQAIRAQGGLVLAPHAFCTLADDCLGEAMYGLLPWLDAVEICNAQSPAPWEDRRAATFAQQHRLPVYVGADAHLRGRLAPCYQMLASVDSPTRFLESLRSARLHFGRFGPWYFARMAFRHFWDLFRDQRLPGFGANAPKRIPETA